MFALVISAVAVAAFGAACIAQLATVPGSDALEATPAASTGLAAPAPAGSPVLTMEQYLDRVMMAESGGRIDLRSHRSTAAGPYQFIERTFFEVARRNFPDETAKLTFAQLLALRFDPIFSRKVAEAYTKETATTLASQGLAPSWQNLRLAYIVGPGGAIRMLKAAIDARLAHLLSPAALTANPFMAGWTVHQMIAKAARDVAVSPANAEGVAPGVRARGAGTPPGLAVHCNLALPSCRHWVALHTLGTQKVASGGGGGGRAVARVGARSARR